MTQTYHPKIKALLTGFLATTLVSMEATCIGIFYEQLLLCKMSAPYRFCCSNVKTRGRVSDYIPKRRKLTLKQRGVTEYSNGDVYRCDPTLF